jgi:hypothetical protein
MKLQNILPHMANSSVLVNGRTYEIDGHGVILGDVVLEDAQKLLVNRAAWRVVVERQAVAEPIAVPPAPGPDPVLEGKEPAEPLPVPEIKPAGGLLRRKK